LCRHLVVFYIFQPQQCIAAYAKWRLYVVANSFFLFIPAVLSTPAMTLIKCSCNSYSYYALWTTSWSTVSNKAMRIFLQCLYCILLISYSHHLSMWACNKQGDALYHFHWYTLPWCYYRACTVYVHMHLFHLVMAICALYMVY